MMALNPACPEHVREQLMQDDAVRDEVEFNSSWTWDSVSKMRTPEAMQEREELPDPTTGKWWHGPQLYEGDPDIYEEDRYWMENVESFEPREPMRRTAKEKYTKKEKERVDKDIRPPTTFMWFRNYDYTDEDPNETSLGGGLYHGDMGKFKSVKEFIEKRRKKLKDRKEKFSALAYGTTKMAETKKYLVLDDDKERHDGFEKCLSRHGQVTHVYTYDEAAKALDKETFDEIFLDHDLGDFGPGPSGYGESERTGADVALYLARIVPEERYPKMVHIHSWNPAGAHNIATILDSAGISYVREPYGDPYSEDDVVMWYKDPMTGKWELKAELAKDDTELVEQYRESGYEVKLLPFGERPDE
jgi:CheY-like chemotaxis protein